MPDSPVYFAHAGGRQIGPLSFAELDALSAKGLLLPTELVWKSDTPDWLPASTFLSFAPSSRAADAPAAAESGPAPASASEAASVPRVAPSPPTGRVARGFRAWVDHLSSYSFSELFPLPRLLDPETLGAPRSWVLLVFGLLPLILGALVEDPLLRVRLFNLGCGAFWTLFFVVAYRTEEPSPRLGTAIFFASAVLGILFLSLLNGFPPLSWLELMVAPERPLALRLLASVLGVGVLQELGKAAVLVLLLRASGGLRHPAEGLFYGLLAGLGFGVWAAVASAGQVGPRQGAVLALFTGPPTLGLMATLVSSIVRMAALPFLHAIWSALVGYYVGLPADAGRKTYAPLALGIFIAAMLHGLYALFLSSGHEVLALLVAALSALLFLAYCRSAEALQGQRGKR